MSLIRLNNVSLKYEDRPVLRNVFFKLQAGERVGLIGKNGTGKTTVLKLILEQMEPTSGTVERAPGLKVSYFSQFSTLDGAQPVQTILEDLFADIRAIEKTLERNRDGAGNRGRPGDDGATAGKAGVSIGGNDAPGGLGISPAH